MDEPLGALDKKLRTHMQLELKHIQQQLHVTVIYVTHDQEEALTMSDRVAVMRSGRIEQMGEPAELYEAPASRFVADFLGESNFIDGVVIGSRGPGRWLVRATGGLELQGVGAVSLSTGQAVTAAIRPEKLVPLVDEAGAREADALNSCAGRVEEAIYVGDATRYRVGLGSDGALTVKVPNRLGLARARAGDRLALAWSPEETRLFSRDDTAAARERARE
jgi:ABC-type Fe3+/spermidine/putrescine transport system ATPase subunit